MTVPVPTPPRRRAPIDVERGPAPTGVEFGTACAIVDGSGLVERIAPHVDADTGRPRALPLRALFVAMMINGLRQDHTALITRVTRVINSLTRAQRRALGIEQWSERGSYHRVQKLHRRVVRVLDNWENLVPRTGEADSALDVLNLLVDAACPPDLILSDSFAIDGTDIPSWGAISGDEATIELDLEEELKELPDHLRKRKVPKPARGKHKAAVIKIGDDGRNVYTEDESARAGWRTATTMRPAGPYIGRECHLMVQTSDVESTNGVSDTKLGPRVPAFIRGFALTPAGTHRGKTAVEMIKTAKRRGVQIADVLVDPGYSLAKAEYFMLPVRREGIHITFLPASHQWKRRPFNDDAVTIGGQLFYAAVPEKLLDLKMPPRGATREQKLPYEQKFIERALYRYRPHSRPDPDGTTRWQSPFAAGSLRSEQLPESMRNTPRGPLVDLVGGRPAGTVSVSAADLPLQQRCIAGTAAHSISMSRRNAVEGVNGNLKNNFTDVDRGYVRLFGTMGIALMLAFTYAGHNVFIAKSFRRMLKAERERRAEPKTRRKRRTGTFGQVLGQAAEPRSGTSEGDSASRAPPGSSAHRPR